MYIYFYISAMAVASAFAVYYAARSRAGRRGEELPTARQLSVSMFLSAVCATSVGGSAAEFVVMNEMSGILNAAVADHRDFTPDEVERLKTLKKWLI